MNISFTNKEEQNKLQEKEFLKLPKAERFIRFLRLQEQISFFPTRKDKVKAEKTKNFVIDLSELGR